MEVTGHHIASQTCEFYGATPERLPATLPAVPMLGLVIFISWDPARSTWLAGRLAVTSCLQTLDSDFFVNLLALELFFFLILAHSVYKM